VCFVIDIPLPTLKLSHSILRTRHVWPCYTNIQILFVTWRFSRKVVSPRSFLVKATFRGNQRRYLPQPSDLTVSKRPGTSYQIEIHFSGFNRLHLLFCFMKLAETFKVYKSLSCIEIGITHSTISTDTFPCFQINWNFVIPCKFEISLFVSLKIWDHIILIIIINFFRKWVFRSPQTQK
jgi:hypothetical protein